MHDRPFVIERRMLVKVSDNISTTYAFQPFDYSISFMVIVKVGVRVRVKCWLISDSSSYQVYQEDGPPLPVGELLCWPWQPCRIHTLYVLCSLRLHPRHHPQCQLCLPPLHLRKYCSTVTVNVGFLPAGRTLRARPAGPKITLLFPRLYICASALITCAIITSRTLLPCDLTLVDGCFA